MELATVCANDGGGRLMKGFLYYSSNTRLFDEGVVFFHGDGFSRSRFGLDGGGLYHSAWWARFGNER